MEEVRNHRGPKIHVYALSGRLLSYINNHVLLENLPLYSLDIHTSVNTRFSCGPCVGIRFSRGRRGKQRDQVNEKNDNRCLFKGNREVTFNVSMVMWSRRIRLRQVGLARNDF
jgi:hypothetical protein